MSGRNVRVLARDAAARLRDAACKEKRDLWNAGEATMEATEDRAEALAAAEPLLEVCWSGCLVRDACREWARIDRYTGVAGGEVVHNGKSALAPRRHIKLAS